MKPIKILAVLICMAFSPDAFGAESKALTPEMILNHCAQAMGSPQQALPVLAEGEVHEANSGSVTPIRIKTRGAEDFLFERGGPEAETFVISNGKGWHHRAEQKSPMSRHTTAYFRPDHLPALVCGTNPASQGMRTTYVGDEVVGIVPVFHLKLDASPRGKNAHADAIESLISEYHVFIDQQSFRVLKTSKFVFAPDAVENRSVWETLYSDYRSINGLLMPFHIETFVSGRIFSTTVFTNIQTNVALSNQEFQEGK